MKSKGIKVESIFYLLAYCYILLEIYSLVQVTNIEITLADIIVLGPVAIYYLARLVLAVFLTIKQLFVNKEYDEKSQRESILQRNSNLKFSDIFKGKKAIVTCYLFFLIYYLTRYKLGYGPYYSIILILYGMIMVGLVFFISAKMSKAQIDYDNGNTKGNLAGVFKSLTWWQFILIPIGLIFLVVLFLVLTG